MTYEQIKETPYQSKKPVASVYPFSFTPVLVCAGRFSSPSAHPDIGVIKNRAAVGSGY